MTRRRSRVRSSVDARLNQPVNLIPTTLAIPVIMNGELRDMQAERRNRPTEARELAESR